jgi:hypothetical protein
MLSPQKPEAPPMRTGESALRPLVEAGDGVGMADSSAFTPRVSV